MAKQNWLNSESARRTIASMPCLIQNKDCIGHPVHAHHVKTRGAGGNDFLYNDVKTLILNLAPLCAFHHDMIHRIGHQSFLASFRAFKTYLTDINHPLKDS